MEDNTVFDFDITPAELRLLFISDRDKKTYLLHTSHKKILQDLYVLFKIREDFVRAGTIGKKLFGQAVSLTIAK